MERRQLIRKTSKAMSIRRQCDILQVSRSGLYYRPLGESLENLKIMELMDRHATTFPAEGVLSMVNMLAGKGYKVNHKRVRRLLGKMGHRTLYPKKYLSQLGLAEYKRPYLLRNLGINRANQVWSVDITYIPMKKGFMYCTGIIDVYSRKIVGWGISNSLEAQHCVDVFEDAVRKHGKPEIINSDQGTQFTSHKWTSAVEHKGIKVSMDGKGRATDNRWIERFWRTLKHQYIYLNPADDGLELHENIKFYIDYYNTDKVHQTINGIPNEIYKESIQKQQILTNNQVILV